MYSCHLDFFFMLPFLFLQCYHFLFFLSSLSETIAGCVNVKLTYAMEKLFNTGSSVIYSFKPKGT